MLLIPAAYGATEINRFRGNHMLNPPITQEVVMEVAIIPSILVAIFVGLAALILFFPYDAK